MNPIALFILSTENFIDPENAHHYTSRNKLI